MPLIDGCAAVIITFACHLPDLDVAAVDSRMRRRDLCLRNFHEGVSDLRHSTVIVVATFLAKSSDVA